MSRILTTWTIPLILMSVVSGQSTDKLPNLTEYKESDIVKFTHRYLNQQEIETYDTLLQQALNLNNQKRKLALIRLSKSPHVKLIKPLAEFICQLQPHHEKPWEKGTLGQSEVNIVARCADYEVIDLLIEFLGHPLRGVRAAALENLQKLVALPKGYRSGELTVESLEEFNKRKAIVTSLKDWWKANKKKVLIQWLRAWFWECG